MTAARRLPRPAAGSARARPWRALAAVVTIIFACLVLPTAGQAGSRTAAAPPGTWAMWLWSNAPADDVITWSKAHSAKEIFVYVPPGGTAGAALDRLRRIKSGADAAGIRVVALGGEADWTFDPAQALAWMREVDATGLFAGHHLDVEPYTLPVWDTDRTGTIRSYLALLNRLRTASPLPLEVDVPFWYPGMTVSGADVATEVLRRVPRVTVMSYRDSGTGPNSMWSVGKAWLDRAATVGGRVRLAAETAPAADCAYCTFAQEGATALGAALASVDAAGQGSPAYAGVAVQHYDAWRALGP